MQVVRRFVQRYGLRFLATVGVGDREGVGARRSVVNGQLITVDGVVVSGLGTHVGNGVGGLAAGETQVNPSVLAAGAGSSGDTHQIRLGAFYAALTHDHTAEDVGNDYLITAILQISQFKAVFASRKGGVHLVVTLAGNHYAERSLPTGNVVPELVVLPAVVSDDGRLQIQVTGLVCHYYGLRFRTALGAGNGDLVASSRKIAEDQVAVGIGGAANGRSGKFDHVRPAGTRVTDGKFDATRLATNAVRRQGKKQLVRVHRDHRHRHTAIGVDHDNFVIAGDYVNDFEAVPTHHFVYFHPVTKTGNGYVVGAGAALDIVPDLIGLAAFVGYDAGNYVETTVVEQGSTTTGLAAGVVP